MAQLFLLACKRDQKVQDFYRLEVPEVDVWHPEVVDEPDVYRLVIVFVGGWRPDYPRLLPPNPEVHREHDGELDVVDLQDLESAH